MKKVTIEILTELGLNKLEAEIYTLLLSHEPMTAYRIGKLLGKPTANVYKAIDSLANKGSVLIEEGKSKVCRAIPADEFLKQLEKDFLNKTTKARTYLSRLKTEIYDERIYKIESIGHIFDRSQKMLDSCKIIAMIDAFPKPLLEIQDAIIDAVNRGIEVYIQAYKPINIPGAHVVIPPQSEMVLKYWASQQLNIVTDGREHILALFNQEISKIYHSTWSENLYLSCILHAGLMHEHTIHQIRTIQENDDAQIEIRKILSGQKYFHNSNIPGQKELFQRYAVSQISMTEISETGE